jgi:hypothetical protein
LDRQGHGQTVCRLFPRVRPALGWDRAAVTVSFCAPLPRGAG